MRSRLKNCNNVNNSNVNATETHEKGNHQPIFIDREIWMNIPGISPEYFVSNLGRVGRNGNGKYRNTRVYKSTPNLSGYCGVYIENSNYYVHRLVALAFIPNPDNKPHVNHINSIRMDNRVENLEWVTAQENVIHSFRHGNRIPTRICGNKSKCTKYSDEQVYQIRFLYKNGYKQSELSKMFGVHPGHVHKIVNNKSRIDVEFINSEP